MGLHTIELEEPDYQNLVQAAETAGVTISLFLKQLLARQPRPLAKEGDAETAPRVPAQQAQSRWAEFSERIRQNPPLRGSGEYVRTCSQELRANFTFKHDEEA